MLKYLFFFIVELSFLGGKIVLVSYYNVDMPSLNSSLPFYHDHIEINRRISCHSFLIQVVFFF